MCDRKGEEVGFLWELVVVYLLRTEARGNPDILLQCTSRVIIRGRVSLEVVHQLGDGLFHLQRHGCHNMLLCTNRFSGHRFSYWGKRQKKTTWGIKMPFLFSCLFLYVKPAGQDWNNILARDTCIHPCLLIILLSWPALHFCIITDSLRCA